MSKKQDCALSLFPPQDVEAVLGGRGTDLQAEVRWQPPRVHPEGVGGYIVERTSWWQGVPRQTLRLTNEPVRECLYVDRTVTPDQIHEYRVQAVHREFADIAGMPSYPAAIYGFAYMRYEEMVEELHAMAKRHSDVCRLVDAGAAGGGRRVWCMVLGTDTSDHPDRPGIFLVGNPHATEVQSADVCMGIVRESLKRYAAGDAEFISILEKVQTRVIPMYNPWGRITTEKGSPNGGRKTRPPRPLPPPLDPFARRHCWRFNCSPGIDPNRTFDAGVRNLPELLNPKSGCYCGKGAFAAPETRALVKMARALRPQISLHYHGPCGYPLYPGGLRPDQKAQDEDLHLEVARAFARLSAPTFCSEDPNDSPTPSDIPGTAILWFYQEYYGAHLCPEGFYEQITVDPHVITVSGLESLKELIPRNFNAFRWLARRVQGPGILVRVTDAKKRPVRAVVEVVGRMDPLCAEQTTDAFHGTYRRILPEGTYTVRISVSGRVVHEARRIRVKGARYTPIEVTLQSEGGKR